MKITIDHSKGLAHTQFSGETKKKHGIVAKYNTAQSVVWSMVVPTLCVKFGLAIPTLSFEVQMVEWQNKEDRRVEGI